MNRKVWVSLSILALAATVLALPAVAGGGKTVTLEGKVMCAKCALHEEGRTKCQNVLVVEKGHDSRHYYMAKNETAEEFGEVCTGSPAVRVTGKVEKKEGKTWIVADTIERLESDKG